MPKGSYNGIRKNVILSTSTDTGLKLIKRKADFLTYAEAVRATVKLYARLMNAQLNGARIEIVSEDGSRTVCDDLYEPAIANAEFSDSQSLPK